jgi:tetratricopeptide (TPR) repeat protein
MTEREDATEDAEASDTEATKREGHVASERIRSRKPKYLERGTLVGRYVIVERLGEGGMGVVYSAFDPELDRKIAIKLLQAKPASGSSGGEQAWLVREAQALARLQHPNVVAVHDVGTLPGDQVFVAMELVDGMTMRSWLKAEARSWREVLPVVRAAGAGLAAAHTAGLVHRDFKPENVLVGKDGRVRVMDFGLARLRRGDEPSSMDSPPPSPMSDGSMESAKSPLSIDLTHAGQVVGTPAYMAPEIYDGHPADARTDQFAFGVTMFEGLFHARPFDRKDLSASRSAPPRPKIPPDAKVPAKLQRIVLRAIAIDPALRFASMDELLAELSRDPLAARRVMKIGAGIAAVAALAGGGVFALVRPHGPRCTGAEGRLAGVWDAPTRQTSQQAFAATKKPYAAKSFEGVAHALDDYAKHWSAAVTESCEATRVRGEQTEEVLSLREACLDQRLEELRAFTALVAQGDGGLVDKGDKAVFALEPLAGCANIAALRAPGLPPPEIRAKALEQQKKLADAKAQMIAGNYLAALTAAKRATDGALALHWEPIAAEALQVRGASLLAVGNSAEAEQALEEATWAAMRGRRDDLVAHCALMAAAVTSDSLGKPQDAQVLADLGNAAATRFGPSVELDVFRFSSLGMLAAERGDLNTAVALYDKANSLSDKVFGKDSAPIVSIEGDYATTLSRAGMYTQAVPHYEHSLALRIASVGPEHPDVALILSNLGLAYRHTGQYQKAHESYAKALAMREKLFGARSPVLVPTLDNFAELLSIEGDNVAAIQMMARTQSLARFVPGELHPVYHQVLTDYGDIMTTAGRLPEAHAFYDQAIALETKTQSNILPATRTSQANLALVERKWAEADKYAQQAIDGFEAAGGKDNPGLWRPLTSLARAKIGAGNAAAARPLLQRALAIAQKAQVSDDDIAPTKDALAKLP